MIEMIGDPQSKIQNRVGWGLWKPRAVGFGGLGFWIWIEDCWMIKMIG